MTAWTSNLPDDERSMLVEEICRAVEHCSDTGKTEALTRLVSGWRAAAEVHSNPDLRAALATEHPGPAVPIKRPAADEVART